MNRRNFNLKLLTLLGAGAILPVKALLSFPKKQKPIGIIHYSEGWKVQFEMKRWNNWFPKNEQEHVLVCFGESSYAHYWEFHEKYLRGIGNDQVKQGYFAILRLVILDKQGKCVGKGNYLFSSKWAGAFLT